MTRDSSKVIPRISTRLSKIQAVLLVPALTLALATAINLIDPVALQSLHQLVFDQYQRIKPRVYDDSAVRIIDIDEASVQKYGQWPWPRTLFAQLVKKLHEAQPKVIAFDIIFSEADRTSPNAMMNFWHIDPEQNPQIAKIPDHDRIFADSLRHSNVVLGFVAEQYTSKPQIPEQKARYLLKGNQPGLFNFSSAIKPLPLLEEAADGIGALNKLSIDDDVIRHVPMVIRMGDKLLPSLSTEAIRLSQGMQNYILTSSATDNVMQQIQIGKFLIPTTSDGDVWVYFTPPKPERYIPAWKVLSGETPAASLAGKILLVGTSAHGLEESKYNALGNKMLGIEAHAQTIEQIVGNQVLNRPEWANAIELLAMMLGGLFIGIMAFRRPILDTTLITFTVLAVFLGLGWLAFSQFLYLIDLFTPGLIILLSFICNSSISHFAGERRQRWLKEAFSRYVSPNRVNYILQHPDDLELGVQRRQCSFIFTDLAGFTHVMETIDPEQAVTWLNAYLDQMIGIAFKYNGTLDRIVGDALAIMFSAPLVQEDHQRRALECALEMQAFASQYVAQFDTGNFSSCQTRIGVHSGKVIVGNFGGSTMFDYRALGDPVNTASRLEGANKYLHTSICVSEATLAGCDDIPARPIGYLLLKGKTQPLKTYQPSPLGTPVDHEYLAAYQLLADNDEKAFAAFAELAQVRVDDPLVELHLKRLQDGEGGELIVIHDK